LIAGVACGRSGDRPHLFYKLRMHRRRKGEPKGFTWRDYRDLITCTHHDLSARLVCLLGGELAAVTGDLPQPGVHRLGQVRRVDHPSDLGRDARNGVNSLQCARQTFTITG
jgi:hypothetical protein